MARRGRIRTQTFWAIFGTTAAGLTVLTTALIVSSTLAVNQWMQMSLKEEVGHLRDWFNQIRLMPPAQRNLAIREQLSDRSARGDIYWIQTASGQRWLPSQAGRIPRKVWDLPQRSFAQAHKEGGSQQWWNSQLFLNTQNLFLNSKGEWMEVRRVGALSYDTDLWVARDARLLRDSIQRYLLTATSVLALMLAIAFLVSRALSRRLIRPIELLNARASQASPEQLVLLGDHFVDAPLELEQLAQSLDGMMVRIADEHAQHRSFARHVSHELRTPLTIIRGYLKRCLKKSDQLPAAALKSIQVADQEAERMIELVSDLLDLSRMNASGLQLRVQVCDLHALLDDVVQRISKTFRRKVGLAIQPQLLDSEGRCVAMVDEKRLRQVLVNLLENSCKYSEAPSPIEISLASQSEWLLFRVADHGIGVPEDEKEHLFEPFMRASNAASHASGTGLGLSVCRLMVQAMSGTIELEHSAPQQGSVFLVRLPRRQGISAELEPS